MPTEKQIDRKKLENIVNSLNISENMNESLWVGDANHITVYVNPTFEKISGYRLEECVGRNCIDFFDENSKIIISRNHQLRKKGVSSQYEATLIAKDGTRVPLLVSGAPTASGGTIGIFTNLTEIKKLSEQETLFNQVIRNTTEAIVILDEDHRVKLWSNGASKIFGYKEAEMLNQPIDTIVPQEKFEENITLIKEVEDRNYLQNHETQRMDKNGNMVDVSISVTKVRNQDTDFIGYLVLYLDITDQKKANRELQKRFEAMQDAYKELGLQKRQIDYVNEIITASTSEATTVDNLEKLIVSAACMLTKCDGAVLRTIDPETGTLKLRACLGISPKWWSKDQVSVKNSLAEEAFEAKRPLVIHNIANSNKHQGTKLVKAHSFTGLILVPLFVADQLIGSLSLYSQNLGQFRLIETDFLESFGHQCSAAIFTKLQSSS